MAGFNPSLKEEVFRLVEVEKRIEQLGLPTRHERMLILMFDKAVDIISKYTDTPKSEITTDTNMLSDLGLQSIDFIDMICDFEEEFDYIVPERDFRKLVTVGNIIAYIEEKAK